MWSCAETAEQHNGLAAFLPAHPRLDTDLREKHERWAVILSDWIQGGSIIDTVADSDRVNPTLRLDLVLLGFELLLWFDEGSEEESAVLNGLRIGFDESYSNWPDFSTILKESVMVREAIIALLTSASDPRRQESQVEILRHTAPRSMFSITVTQWSTLDKTSIIVPDVTSW